MNEEDYVAVPYVLDVTSIKGASGEWVCRLEYEDLPGCVAEARSPLDALDEVERLREEYILSLVRDGRPLPPPRGSFRAR
jgi:predicted RNase H-like HicB family nuclease